MKIDYFIDGYNTFLCWNYYIYNICLFCQYIYIIYKCYYDMRYWKFRKIEIQRELREFKTTKEDEDRVL